MMYAGMHTSQSDPERALAFQIRAVGLREPVAEYPFALPRRWRFDFAWPELRLAVEIEGGTWTGGRHVRGSGYERDLEKYNAAALLGYTVLRVTPAMVEDGRAIAAVERFMGREEEPDPPTAWSDVTT